MLLDIVLSLSISKKELELKVIQPFFRSKETNVWSHQACEVLKNKVKLHAIEPKSKV